MLDNTMFIGRRDPAHGAAVTVLVVRRPPRTVYTLVHSVGRCTQPGFTSAHLANKGEVSLARGALVSAASGSKLALALQWANARIALQRQTNRQLRHAVVEVRVWASGLCRGLAEVGQTNISVVRSLMRRCFCRRSPRSWWSARPSLQRPSERLFLMQPVMCFFFKRALVDLVCAFIRREQPIDAEGPSDRPCPYVHAFSNDCDQD